jgi:hypothetical protein
MSTITDPAVLAALDRFEDRFREALRGPLRPAVAELIAAVSAAGADDVEAAVLTAAGQTSE